MDHAPLRQILVGGADAFALGQGNRVVLGQARAQATGTGGLVPGIGFANPVRQIARRGETQLPLGGRTVVHPLGSHVVDARTGQGRVRLCQSKERFEPCRGRAGKALGDAQRSGTTPDRGCEDARGFGHTVLAPGQPEPPRSRESEIESPHCHLDHVGDMDKRHHQVLARAEDGEHTQAQQAQHGGDLGGHVPRAVDLSRSQDGQRDAMRGTPSLGLAFAFVLGNLMGTTGLACGVFAHHHAVPDPLRRNTAEEKQLARWLRQRREQVAGCLHVQPAQIGHS